MSPRKLISIPREIHLMILEFLLSDKSLYSSIEKHYSYTSVSKWIGLSLVCRAWRNRIHTLAFHHVSALYRTLTRLRALALPFPLRTDLLPTMLSSVYPPTLDYIHELTLVMEATDHLPEAISILSNLPHLNRFTIDLSVGDWELDLDNPVHPGYLVTQVTCLGIRLCQKMTGKVSLRNTGIRWILSRFPSVEHLYIYVWSVDDSDPNPPLHHSLPPGLVSLASTGWLRGLFGYQIAIPTLRFLEIWCPTVDEMQPFADYHCNTLEGLHLVYMDVNDDQIWEEIISRFNSLQYLSVCDEEVISLPLERVNTRHLRHFALSLNSADYSSEEISRVAGLLTTHFPNLRVLTYRSDVRLAPIHDLEKAGSLDVVWKPFLPLSLMDHPYATPYTCWEDTISPYAPFPPVVRHT
ncbi:hypothetical protein BDV93DRAFT_520312 [Ceratobasidium sp. AG-I]|nr:hypothetical protein BDV93DRAFT_520312 [Ceratobasidium sp. AG-I]